MIRAIRGATTVEKNEKEEIFGAVTEMVSEIMDKNGLVPEDVTDMIFTVTPDITAAFPAAAVRKIGISDVPLLDMAAPDIEGALHMCIRVMVHAETSHAKKEIVHAYMRRALRLRPDLASRKISVAIDGPAGAGKSSIAKRVANDLGYIYIDTGAMYRTVGVYALKNGIDIETEQEKLIESLPDIHIDIRYEGNEQRMFLNGEDVSKRIRENDASMAASAVAAIPAVRERLVKLQKQMAEKGGVIMDGRDIGTTVLPDAELKIYLTASVDARAERRYIQNKEKGIECTLDEIRADVIERDHNDMTRAVSPLRQAADAVAVDTTALDFEGSVEKIKDLILNI